MKSKVILISILETVLVNFALYYFFYEIQPNQDLYLKLNPHPLIILCIVISLRYGNYIGVFFATVSTIFYGKVFYDIQGDLLTLISDISNYKFVLILFWSSMIFGTYKDNFKAKIENLTKKNILITESMKKLSKSYELNQHILNELKKQIINSEESILQLYQIASSLETFNSEEIYTETIGILSRYLKAETVSVYTCDESSSFMRLKIRLGNSVIESRSLNINDSIGFKKVVREKKVVRFSDVEDNNFPLMSAPLIKDNKVIAVVNIENMNFDSLSEYAFQLFKIIIDWVNKALQQAIYVDELSDSKYIDGMRLMRYDAFIDRFNEEERRKKEFGMEYSLLKYRVKNLSIEDINNRITKVLRAVDVISFDQKRKMLFVLLPATPQKNSFIVDQRIIDELGNEVVKIRDDLNLKTVIG